MHNSNKSFFLSREEWIPAPSDWAASIVQGKSYDTQENLGREIWMMVQEKLTASNYFQQTPELDKIPIVNETEHQYGLEYLTRRRIGQGTFRILVTEAYSRRCTITGERTLPALEAAHIKPFSLSGPNLTSNGLLLRSDLHKLFDHGYISITPKFSVEVSKKIKEEYENGRDYYAFHGKKLLVIPSGVKDRPSPGFLQWHNENIYLG